MFEALPKFAFFTGKGGVGKTSLACATALGLAERGRRVLLISTDPASNVGQVFETEIGNRVTRIPGVEGLDAIEIDPEDAAAQYRERIVGPMRGTLPADQLKGIEEQLSGACTTEIAAFDEFTALLTDRGVVDRYDHLIFDTAPTGHTIRLLKLPGAWTGFLEAGRGDASCLGPLSGLEKQRGRYAEAVARLADAAETLLVLVARPQRSALAEAARTARELAAIGIANLHLAINGTMPANTAGDPLAASLRRRDEAALAGMPEQLRFLPRSEHPLRAFNLVGLAALRAFATGADVEEPDRLVASSRRRGAAAGAQRPRRRHRGGRQGPRDGDGQGRGRQDHDRRRRCQRAGGARQRGPADHHRPGRPPDRDAGRRPRQSLGQPHRPRRRDGALPRGCAGQQGQGPRRSRPGHARGRPALAVHRGDRGVPGVLPNHPRRQPALRRARHRADRAHPAAAGRDRLVPPRHRPTRGAGRPGPHRNADDAAPGSRADQDPDRDPAGDHAGAGSVRSAGGSAPRRHRALGLGDQRQSRRRRGPTTRSWSGAPTPSGRGSRRSATGCPDASPWCRCRRRNRSEPASYGRCAPRPGSTGLPDSLG